MILNTEKRHESRERLKSTMKSSSSHANIDLKELVGYNQQQLTSLESIHSGHHLKTPRFLASKNI